LAYDIIAAEPEEPIRAELFSLERLEQHAESLAKAQKVARGIRHKKPLPRRLRENERVLDESYRVIAKAAHDKRPITQAGEWLLDNYHIVATQIREVRNDLPPDYYRELPKLREGHLTGYPRVYGIAWAIVAHTDSAFDLERLTRFVTAYQRVEPLTIGELWAIAITLRLTLIENLRRLAVATASRTHETDRADVIVERALSGNETADAIIRELGSKPIRAATVTRLEQRLRDQGSDAVEVLRWLEGIIAGSGLSAEQLVRDEIQNQGAANVSIGNIITSMRMISDVDWVAFVESVSLVDRILAGGSAFRAMEISTRNRYRRAVEKLARYSERGEIEVATAAIDQTQRAARGDKPASRRDPGFYLVGRGRADFEHLLGYSPPAADRLRRGFFASGLGGYLGATAFLTLAIAVGVTLAVVHASPAWLVAALLALLPASDLAMALVNRIVTDRWGPSLLPGMDLRDGVPDSCKSLLVVPTLLSSMQEIDDLASTLEVHYLSNAERNIDFALLSDWIDSDSELTPQDQALLDAAIAAVAGLNRRYGGQHFHLLHRKRQWNAAQGKWMGWERKRGKLHELNRFLRGAQDTTFIVNGPETYERVKDVRYVITVDTDTRLPRGAARRLIGKMAHPLNTPVIDPDLCRVVEGHGILQPRVTPSLPSAADVSLFQWAFSGPNGLDPYAFAVSDVYQDLFDEGSYVGKGIYDVDTFETVLRQRIPENTVLSHDLLEGSFARAALASDIEVVEEFPSAYDVEVKRQHRWMRGDWQLLPWIFASGRDQAGGGKRAHIPLLARWKMLDNLRRSLAAPAMLLAFLYGWTLPWPDSAWWTLFLLAAIALPPFLPIALSLLPHHVGVSRRAHVRNLMRDAVLSLTQILFIVSFLARAAWLSLDAMCRTLFRLFISRRYMLQWVSFAHSKYGRHADGTGFALQLAGAFAFAGAAAALIYTLQPQNLIAAPFLALWAFSPAIARWASRSPEIHEDLKIGLDDETALRVIARETWRFFETFVNAESNFLPPDNFQEDPKPVVAQRTSPTNIGLYLMSVLAARDFGWIGTAETLDRIEATLETLKKLEWYRGHLLNWYENTALASLHPRYVSSVDSGNFAGNLLVMATVWRQTLEGEAPPPDRLRGAADNAALFRRAVERASGDTTALRAALDALERGLRSAPHDDAAVETLAPHIDAIAAAAGDRDDETGICARALRDWLASHRRDLRGAPDAGRIRAIAEWCESTVRGMDFTFLQHRDRQLLSIGFRVDDQALDANAYDLLASEARLASFLAVAKGDIPTRNWFRLGRALIPLRHGSALLSWSGSMFEYLMPSLLMHEPEGSILAQSNRLAVEQQIAYGNKHGIPWGISESQFNARDRAQNYQYSGFGVPILGLKRGLSENIVISPYATGLAVMLKPHAALKNFGRLTSAGAKGRYGFYEALDYTRARLPEGAQVAIVRSFMAHHQAMVIVAIANVVQDGRMRKRFHAEPMVRATELLLQERMPRDVPVSRPPPQIETGAIEQFQYAPPAQRRFTTPYTAIPRTHIMSNGRYSVMLTAAGGGYSQWNGIAVTRWREDPTRDHWGSFVYLRDTRSGSSWSAGFQPSCAEPETYEALFCEDRVQIIRNDVALTTTMEVIVSPEDDTEVRRIAITNHGTRTREIDVTSYAELALARPGDDAAHPVFSKMFVQTEFDAGLGALFATRRKRSANDPDIWAAHLSVVDGETLGEVQYETDRGRFLSRGRTTRAPAAITEGWPLSNTVGAVLDPVFSLRRRVVIPRGKTVTVTFWTMVAQTRDEVVDLADKHHDGLSYTRAATMAATQGHAQLQYLGIGTDEAHLFQSLASWVLYSDDALRCAPDILYRGGKPASSLWSMGISGDLPIVILRTDDPSDVGMARQLLQAHAYWRSKQLAVDVVLLNERASSYAQDLQNGLDALVRNVDRGGPLGSVHLLRADLLAGDVRDGLLAAARVVLSPRRGTLAEQVTRALDEKTPPAVRPRRIASLSRTEPALPALPALEFANGFGGFADDGRTYTIVMENGQTPPAPWINVIANPQFGFQVSAQGSGFTWARNSQQNQLTGWSNDPVSNESSEILYIRDLESGEVWSPTAYPLRDNAGRYVAQHGHGYSRFDYTGNGIASELTMFAALNDPVKISRLRLTNKSARPRKLSLTAYVEWSLGAQRTRGASHICTAVDSATQLMTAWNRWSEDFGHAAAFLDLRGKQASWTGDRREFLGRNGSPDRPAALANDRPLSGRTGAGHDPCGAMQTLVEIAPGATVECDVLLGQGESVEAAQDLARKYRDADLEKSFAEVTGFWDSVLGTIQVKTPDRAMDLMLNRWLLYQALGCRMWGRAGFYQVSGAYGFRDQLQDSLALCAIRPDLARAQILRAAGRQFAEGDVQHWWLPETGKGIRTRISDDRAWLGYVVSHYLVTTGDTAILDEQLPFLEGQSLKPDEGEAFFEPGTSASTASLYEHVARALDASLATGTHGLPHIGTGDWNDGMNRVGEHGRGESVWLGWFLFDVLSKLAPIAENRGDGKRAANWLLHAASLKESIESNAWDGDWYRRAYYDDGSPLGSVTNGECRIDSIAQSWSVLSKGAQPGRAARAMEALDKYLVRGGDEIVLLFNPPFVNTDHDPGYIKGYPAGMRENGGQYTHAALWAVAAFAELGNAAKAHELYQMINPITHGRNRTAAQRYRLEPYVVAADVYSVPPHVGRGGWSWYTGSASWMYRVGMEWLLGIKLRKDRLVIDPCIPAHWEGFTATVRHGRATYEITVTNPRNRSRGVAEMYVDGLPTDIVALKDDGTTHNVHVVMGEAQVVTPYRARAG
jgi:cyclic beta-1,2-glucan synthetase